MLINISDLVAEFKLHINGILHIGAHKCEELSAYNSIGVSNDSIIWVESNENLKCYHPAELHVIYETVSDTDNKECTFNITNDTQCSSMLELDECIIEHPSITVVGTQTVNTTTVDTMLKKYGKNPDDYNFLNLDIQGTELFALKGSTNYLKSVNYIYTEVNTKHIYKDCPLINDINKFLFDNGFELIKYAFTDHGWGDAFYIRRQVYNVSYNSQLAQDKWVMHDILKNRRNGYFVEFGAHNGVTLSNTHYMENALGFSGICIEPNPKQYQMLLINRKCICSNDLISSETGNVCNFIINNEYSGILDNNSGGIINISSKDNNVIQLTTISLYDLLQKYNAPNTIDYLSIDVEGHEYEILRTFRFDKYKFKCITIEHNEPHHGSKMRDNIRTLLESNGYKFVKGNDDICGWGHGPIDDFYVLM